MKRNGYAAVLQSSTWEDGEGFHASIDASLRISDLAVPNAQVIAVTARSSHHANHLNDVKVTWAGRVLYPQERATIAPITNRDLRLLYHRQGTYYIRIVLHQKQHDITNVDRWRLIFDLDRSTIKQVRHKLTLAQDKVLQVILEAPMDLMQVQCIVSEKHGLPYSTTINILSVLDQHFSRALNRLLSATRRDATRGQHRP